MGEKIIPAESMASLGGKARAEKLSPQERKRIAEKAADARWKVLDATHEGVIHLAGHDLTAAVLSDGRRVLDQQAFRQAIGKKGKQRRAVGAESAYGLQSFLDAANLKPYVDKALQAPTAPIVFRTT